MLPEQRTTFEAMAVSSAFDTEGIGKQDSLWTILYLTPRVFEKEAEDKELHEAQQEALEEAEQKATQEFRGKIASHYTKQAVARENESGGNLKEERSACLPEPHNPSAKEIVVGYWDPELYHSKILWPAICLFAVSFGALHLISWHTVFPTRVEQWLWRAAALVSISSMLIFIHFEKVVLRWAGPLTIISLVSPATYLLSRIVMIGGVIAGFRASDPAIYDTYIVSTYWIYILEMRNYELFFDMIYIGYVLIRPRVFPYTGPDVRSASSNSRFRSMVDPCEPDRKS